MKKAWYVFGGALVLLLLIPLSFGGFSLPPEKPAPSATIIFAGDMLFDRYIRRVGETASWDYPFSCVDAVLQDADLVVANLEGPITGNPSVAVMNAEPGEYGFKFTFPPAVAAYLARHNIRLVTLGNNHAFDFGYDGVSQTVQNLKRAGVRFIGPPRFPEGLSDMEMADYTSATMTVKGTTFAMIAYNEFDPEGASASSERALAAIRDAKESGTLPVVFAHWGDEYSPATSRVKSLAHRFADAGAKLIVGAHPHVVQEHETYGGALIYYSLGNFIFDQYWDEKVSRGLLLKTTFADGKVASVSEIPVILMKDGRTCPAESEAEKPEAP